MMRGVSGVGAMIARWRALPLVLALATAAARADVVAATGRPAAVGVAIVEVKGGDLTYRLPNGEEIARRFADVEYLQITGWSPLNAGEKARRDGRLAEAAKEYEAALGELSFAGGRALPGRERLDRALLVRSRLVQTYDAAGRFDRALEHYLGVVDGAGGAAWLEPLRPSHLPDASWNWEGARVLVDRCIERHAADAVGSSLKAWREIWPAKAGGDGGRSAASQPAAAVASVSPEALAAIRSTVEAGRFEEAVRLIGALQRNATAPELWYWHGRALEGRAAKLNGEERDVALRRAGLAYMRVVIYCSEHEAAPRMRAPAALVVEALYRAGAVCERTGDRAAAERLWKELVTRYPQSGRWAEEGRKALARSKP